ncbi:hypothetical protein ABW20_dc0104894 [Dactylellina cionopaga]|nr:hypothetical protein ABW20_dc0104894 [Dactylellina cionopaga]
MVHYNDLIGKTIYGDNKPFDINQAIAMTSGQFSQDCFSMPRIIENCVGAISDDKIVISAKIQPLLAPFFIKKAIFETDGRLYCMSSLEFVESSFVDNEVKNITSRLFWHAPSKAPGQGLIEAAEAIKENLHIYDAFGRASTVDVNKIESPPLKILDQGSAYQSIRNAMIIGLADQISAIEALKRNEASEIVTRASNAKILAEKAKLVAQVVGNLVSNANLNLAKQNFDHAVILVARM